MSTKPIVLSAREASIIAMLAGGGFHECQICKFARELSPEARGLVENKLIMAYVSKWDADNKEAVRKRRSK